MATKKDVTPDYQLIESALERLKNESRFILPEDKRDKSIDVNSRLFESNVRTAFRNLILDSKSADELQTLYAQLETEPATHAMMNFPERAVARVLNIEDAVSFAMFSPSKGSFDWSKTDWESRHAEVEAYKSHIEKVIFHSYGYRLYFGNAKTA